MRPTLRVASMVGLIVGATMASIDVSAAMPANTTLPAAIAPVEQVAWGCGPGWHPNPWGRCFPNGPGWGAYYYGGWYRPWGWGWDGPWGVHGWGWDRL